VLVIAAFLAFHGFIPAGVKSRLAVLTFLLAVTLGLAVAAFRSRPAGLAALPRWLRRGAALGLPIGLVLLVYCGMAYVRPVAGVQRYEIVAPPRPASCVCRADYDDARCLYLLGADPAAIERCWGGSRVRRNRLLWSLAFLLSSGGVLSLVALVWCRSPAQRRGVQPKAAKEARRGLFLSYAREDGEFAERLARDLAGRVISVWWDRWDVEVGDSLPQRIEEAIAGSRWFGVVLSPDSIASRWVRTELDLALTLEIEGEGITILPILLRPCEIPLSLRRKVWADFTGSYATGLAGVLRSLGLEGGPPAASQRE
jgi:TIR domain-containing protein